MRCFIAWCCEAVLLYACGGRPQQAAELHIIPTPHRPHATNERLYAPIQPLPGENPGQRIVVLNGDDHYVRFDAWQRGR